MSEQEQPKKRRGRPPKALVRPEGADAAPELVTAPQDALQEVLEAPRKKPRPPSAPTLAKEIVDYVLDSYDWKPGEFSTLLTAMRYIPRMGRHWALSTRKQ